MKREGKDMDSEQAQSHGEGVRENQDRTETWRWQGEKRAMTETDRGDDRGKEGGSESGRYERERGGRARLRQRPERQRAELRHSGTPTPTQGIWQYSQQLQVLFSASLPFFNSQMFTQCLLHARHWARPRGHNSEETRRSSCLRGTEDAHSLTHVVARAVADPVAGCMCTDST